jgi:hypothetical protein
MRVLSAIVGVTALIAYRLLTMGVRRRARQAEAAQLAAARQTHRELLIDPTNKSHLYVVARRCRKNRKFLMGNGQPHDHMADFERELEDAVKELEQRQSVLGRPIQYSLRYEYDIWRSSWFELVAKSLHQPDIMARVQVTGLQ